MVAFSKRPEMRRSREDLLVKVSASSHPIENLLVQFSILSLVIMAILAIVISVILTTRLTRDFDLLKQQAAQVPNPVISELDLDRDLNYLRWTTYVAVGGGFVILYTGLVWLVWRGWRTIRSQQMDLLDTNSDLRTAYREIQEAQERIVRMERLAAIGELTAKEQERKRLAEELHDETMAELASVVVDLGILSRSAKQIPPELDDALSEIRDRVRGGERRLRQIVRGIFPSVLTNLGSANQSGSDTGRPLTSRGPGGKTHRQPPPVETGAGRRGPRKRETPRAARDSGV